uniref:Uncharacterized protein n=1 Tax=Nelumbo nucifera TaxID=4432 RepID=A0A822Y286_NELNU|nr:TPA_asm: hypothetical protein HUJ06_027541 [Nelumbo nucifera]
MSKGMKFRINPTTQQVKRSFSLA